MAHERQNKCQQIIFIVKDGCIGSSDDLASILKYKTFIKKDREFLHFYTISIIKSRLPPLIFGYNLLLQ